MDGVEDHITLTKLGNELNLPEVPGITTPYIYGALGTLSFTGFHTEDGGLPSVNINLRGAVKYWGIANTTMAPQILKDFQGEYIY
jgi:hypothetical protein